MSRFSLLIFLFASITAFAQKVGLDTIARIPKELTEISGMERDASGIIWAINDSGNQPYVYQINERGEIIKKTWIANATNQDWEELTQDDKGNLYIGDFGNNRNNRKDLLVYVVRINHLMKQDTATAQRIEFVYEDQSAFPPEEPKRNFDMEAMVYYKNRLILFSKNRTEPFTGYSNLYQLPTVPGVYEAEKIDSLYLGKGPKELYQLTAAALSPDGKRLALMSYDKFYVVYDFPYGDLIGGRIELFEFEEVSQKESVVWQSDSVLLISDEKSVLGGGNMYALDLSDQIKNNSKVRREEVDVPRKEFGDSLTINVKTELRGPIYYEFYSGEGERVNFGKVGYFDRGDHEFVLAPPEFPNGMYMLNIQIGSRPHAFFVYRYNPVDWEEVKNEFQNNAKERQNRQTKEPDK